ncbi:MAG: type IV toxin-antitoxin system AbiEi family antitoxin domain-containing protein [Candidatus Methanodesulfokora sp.]
MPRYKHSHILEKLRSSSLFTYSFLECSVGSYAKLLIHRLRKKGEIEELVKGVYTFKKSPYMIVKAIPMSYIGLGSAAFLHGAWEQVTAITVLSPLVSSSVKGGMREIAGYKVHLRRISEKMYFGYDYMFIEEIEELVRVSDPEKTLIDLLYYRYPFRNEIIPRLVEIVDKEKLIKYADEMRRRGIRGWRSIRGNIRV